jgi:transposase
MRGQSDRQAPLLVTVNLEDAIPRDHPIRAIKKLAESALSRMDATFAAAYPEGGRRSIPPEVLLKAQLLIFLYGMRSERLFCERLRWDLLFQWFLDMATPSEGFDATTFTKNRDRILTQEIVKEFFGEVLVEAKKRRLLSEDHFTVDGTLLEAAASMKSFRKKGGDGPGGGNPDSNFRGEKRSNKTHASTTDPDARLYRKGDGKASQLCYIGNILTENRNGICVDAELTHATGMAERQAALVMVTRSTKPDRRRVTLGADKGYDAGEFLVALVEQSVHPHVAQKTGVKPLIDRRTTARGGYLVSQRKRKLVEQVFGWVKTAGALGKIRLRGPTRVATQFLLSLTTLNLIRIANLDAAA